MSENPIFAKNKVNMEKDAVFETAERYVKCTGKSVFLTGKAGTGKTTFLKYITETVSRRFVVLAPTGVAAMNAGGMTIHSFFQLPLCPYLPDVKELVTEYQLPERYHSLRKERIKMIRTLDLLIIDEISMVRADLLDAVDMSLRRYRRCDRPFGGVQLLMIGDVHQLSPVVKESERPYMSQVYPSPYFFHSKALQELDYVTIELQKVHRQKDAEFLEILNAVREDRLTEKILHRLNSRVNAFAADDDVIRLTTHNSQADNINSVRLADLPGEAVEFEAEVEGEFSENSYPADQKLVLKPGAKVMFIRNDQEGKYYNGKLAKVESISRKGIVTVIDELGQAIDVAPVEWENIRYSLDDESGEIRPDVAGVFRQIPLRVAWAVTIHKSQGLTFDKVVIDAGAAFAFGQVYVALSRCRTIEGVSLETPIRMSSIYADSYVTGFNSCLPTLETVTSSLETEERRHKFEHLREVFSVADLVRNLRWYLKTWHNGPDELYPSEYQGLHQRLNRADELKSTGAAFAQQLRRIEVTQPQDDAYLSERVSKAAAYYLPIIEDVYTYCSGAASLEVDNKETRKRMKEASDELFISLDILRRTYASILTSGFSVEEYARVRTEALLEDRTARKRLKKLVKAEGESGVVNEELRDRLQEWRKERFKKDNVPAYMIMHQSTLLEIAALIPKTKAELLSVKGFGKASFEKYGEEILGLTKNF